MPFWFAHAEVERRSEDQMLPVRDVLAERSIGGQPGSPIGCDGDCTSYIGDQVLTMSKYTSFGEHIEF